MTRRLPARAIPVLAGLIFLATGVALLPWPGVQNDEVFFSGPIYAPDAAFYRIEVGALKIPLMVISYTGALKTWLYAGLFRFFAPTEWSVRIPVLLMGIGTIWLTWEWVRRIAGERAAAVAAALLATDTIFLMTDLFDWGPVALQHLLLMGGLLAVQIWIARPSRRMLSLGFFLWGLGMWDKALMAWPLIGLGAAVICVFPRETARRLRLVPAAIALVSFLAGASPLIWYNIARPGETATQNAKFTTVDFGDKLTALRVTIDGSTLFGYLVYNDFATGKRARRGLSEQIPVELSRWFGNHGRNWMLPAWILGFICALSLWNSPARRLLLFLSIFLPVVWIQMALTKGTGYSSHHVILLWPFPAVFLGVAFSAAARRMPRWGAPVLAALVIFLAGENLLTTNQYLARLIVNGGAGGWTDAIYRLSDSVSEKSASWFGILDWGYLNGLRLFHEGNLPLFVVDVNADPKELRREIDSPDYLFIRHTDDKEIFPGINDKFRKAASQAGYAERVVRTVPDRNGRPVFELFRFSKL